MFHTIRWTPEKIRQRLKLIEPLVYRQRLPLPPFRHRRLSGSSVDPPVSAHVQDGSWPSISWGSYWCEPNADFVLRTRFRLPSSWGSTSPAALYLPIGEAGDFSHPEALAYIDGLPYAACDRHHQEIILPPQYLDGTERLLALHGWAGSLRGDPNARLLMRQCALVQIDQPTRDFVALARVALGVADLLNENVPTRGQLLSALDEAFCELDTREPLGDRFYASVSVAHRALRRGVARAGPPLDVYVTAAGQAHIDLAWLWPLAQTRQKAKRTFYNVIRLMEQFPEFCYSQSQAQLYEFVRQDDAGLFEVIRQRVAERRWEPLGGMWVEPDTNLASGESLARQFLLGRTFFRQHFAAQGDSIVLWLPDVFGFCWSLPQLLKEAGLRYFFTIKLGWNEYNRLPYDSFWWQGLDGTRVLTHFSPTRASESSFASTFNAHATPDEVLQTWHNFQQKGCGGAGVTAPLLMSYGYGDGGGGPTREMLENIREMAHFPAMPRLRIGTVGGFFRQLEDTVGGRLPTWNGELYLEFHRGTYTTQSRAKRANRKSELLLHDAEFLAAVASLADADYNYPHADLQRAWERVCLNQFHDILPGSSIGAVYTESLQQYEQVRQIGERICQDALAAVAARLDAPVLLVNPTSFPRRDVAFWPTGEGQVRLQRPDGSPIPTQPVEGGLLLDPGELPPYSITPRFLDNMPAHSSKGNGFGPPAPPCSDGFSRSDSPGSRDTQLCATPNLLENDFLRVELNAAGDIVRIYDRQNDSDVLPSGAIANQFQAFEDRPRHPDAWDIDVAYEDKMWLAAPAASVEVIESGPLRGAIEVRRRILNSDYVQRISLSHNQPRLDFDTVIQWHERHILLKVAFPADVLSPCATYEIPFGSIERPTHRNTSWDWARFEVPAQKWADVSEGGYGVSLLNDSKYGYDVHDNVIRLSLLRGTTYPDPDADQGEHRFAYSLFPHAGGCDERTASQAYALNDPIIAWTAPNAKDGDKTTPNRSLALHSLAFVSVDTPNVIIETVKRAQDDRGLIVRLFESQRCRGNVMLTTAFPLAAAWRTNLLEDDQELLEVSGSCLSIYIKPYQIVTVRLLPATEATA